MLVKTCYAVKVKNKHILIVSKGHSIKKYIVSVLQCFSFSFWRMDATQIINDSLLESDEEENEDNQTSKGRPVAKLHILKNEHMPETGEWMNVSYCTRAISLCNSMCCVVFPSLRIATLFGRQCFGPGW